MNDFSNDHYLVVYSAEIDGVDKNLHSFVSKKWNIEDYLTSYYQDLNDSIAEDYPEGPFINLNLEGLKVYELILKEDIKNG